MRIRIMKNKCIATKFPTKPCHWNNKGDCTVHKQMINKHKCIHDSTSECADCGQKFWMIPVEPEYDCCPMCHADLPSKKK